MGDILEGFNKAKAWYKSKTFIGLIISLIGVLIPVIFPQADVDVQAILDGVETDGAEVALQADEIVAKVISLIGLVIAAYGRAKAQVKIKPLTEDTGETS